MSIDTTQIQKRIEDIRDASGDYEIAHVLEDELHKDVLAAIAEGAPNAAELAREALVSLQIDFVRYAA